MAGCYRAGGALLDPKRYVQEIIVRLLVRHPAFALLYASDLVCTVVLGGDTPYALPAILELEKQGYIIIASVSTSEAIDILESQSRGYVKAHVLDPFEVSFISLSI
jgi:hypothetical protein